MSFSSLLNFFYIFLVSFHLSKNAVEAVVEYGSGKMWTKNELKVLVDPGSRQCFYQFVEIEAVFHSSYQVTEALFSNFNIFILLT